MGEKLRRRSGIVGPGGTSLSGRDQAQQAEARSAAEMPLFDTYPVDMNTLVFGLPIPTGLTNEEGTEVIAARSNHQHMLVAAPAAADPVGTVRGQLFFNTARSKLRLFDSVWVDVAPGVTITETDDSPSYADVRTIKFDPNTVYAIDAPNGVIGVRSMPTDIWAIASDLKGTYYAESAGTSIKIPRADHRHTLVARVRDGRWPNASNAQDSGYIGLWYDAVNDDLVSSKWRGWEACGTADTLNDQNFGPFYFVDEFYGFAVSNINPSWQMLYTSDGGSVWSEGATFPSSSYTVNDIVMVSRTVGWVVGDGGHISSTSDGWITANIDRPYNVANPKLNAISAASPTDAFAVGENSTILYWNGVAWVSKAAPVAGKSITCVHAISATRAICGTTDGRIFRGSAFDAWTEATFDVAPTVNYKFIGMRMFDTNNGLAVCVYSSNVWVYSTADGGATWTRTSFQSVSTTGYIHAYIENTSNIYMCGTGTKIYASTDGGETWVAQTASSGAFRRVQVIGQYGWMWGGNTMYRTTTAGNQGWGSSLGRIFRDYIDQSVKSSAIPTFRGVIIGDSTADPQYGLTIERTIDSLTASTFSNVYAYATLNVCPDMAYGFYAGIADTAVNSGINITRYSQYNNLTWDGTLSAGATLSMIALMNFCQSTGGATIDSADTDTIEFLGVDNIVTPRINIGKPAGDLALTLTGARSTIAFDMWTWVSGGGSAIARAFQGSVGLEYIGVVPVTNVGADLLVNGGAADNYGVRVDVNSGTLNYAFYSMNGDWAIATDSAKLYFGASQNAWITWDGSVLLTDFAATDGIFRVNGLFEVQQLDTLSNVMYKLCIDPSDVEFGVILRTYADSTEGIPLTCSCSIQMIENPIYFGGPNSGYLQWHDAYTGYDGINDNPAMIWESCDPNTDSDMVFLSERYIMFNAPLIPIGVSGTIDLGDATHKIGDIFHGGQIGFFGTAPVSQRAHIANPSGGGTQDAEARTAINSILTALETLGLVASS